MTSASHNNRRSDMYRLRDLKNGLFQLHAFSGEAYEGTWVAICSKAEDLGIEPGEMIDAKDELKKNNHDYAEFGVNRTFIFTTTDKKRVA